MICSHCVREVPDGSSFCPRCGGALNSVENVSQPQAAAEIHALLDDGGGWEPAAPTKVIRSNRGWEQTGQFTSSVHREREERALPAYSVFSPRGRLNRLKFFYMQLISSFAMVITFTAQIFVFMSASPLKEILSLLVLPVNALICVVQVFATVRRFHDIDEPGIHYLFLLIPFYNIYISLKLLFKSSAEEYNDYGETVNNHYYWQAPLTLLLLPIVYLSIGLGSVGDSKHLSMLSRNPFERQYYSEQYQVGITFPNGWIRTDLEGSLASAQQAFFGLESIVLNARKSDLPSFDTLTREQLEQVCISMSDDKLISTLMQESGTQFVDVSDAYSNVKDINGKMFIQFGFKAKYKEVNVRGIVVLGAYNGRSIILAMCVPLNASDRTLDTMMDSADSLVVDNLSSD